MKKLREVVHSFLKLIHPRIYFQVAPDDAQFPYIVYDFTQIVNDGQEFETIVIDIDGWDIPNNGDTTLLETLMETLNDTVNKRTLTAENLAVTFYLDRKLSLTDNDPQIKRRKYIYQARLFGRS